MSRWFVGSSRIRQFAPESINRQSSSRVRSPPESDPTGVPHLVVAEQELREERDRLALVHRLRFANGFDGRERRVLALEALLEVADPDGRSDPALSRCRLELTGEDPPEHGFPGAVRADDTQPLSAVDVEGDIEQHRVVVERHRDLAEPRDPLSPSLGGTELERHLPALEHGAIHLVHLIDLALLVPRLPDVSLVRHTRKPRVRSERSQPRAVRSPSAASPRLAADAGARALWRPRRPSRCPATS